MYEMQTTVTNARGVCLSVSLSVTNAPNDPGSASLGRVRRVPYVRGHSVQPLPNAFGLSFGFSWHQLATHGIETNICLAVSTSKAD